MLIFIFFLTIPKLILSMIFFPFGPAFENKNGAIDINNSKYNFSHYLNDYFIRKLYISLKIGSPPQEVKSLLTSEDCGFKIGKSLHCINSNDKYLSVYNRNNSKDFSYTYKFNMSFTEFDDEKGSTAQDSIYAYTDINLKQEKSFKDIGFFLGSDTKDKLCGIIGFKMDNYLFHCNKISNIIRSFHSTKVITNYKWTLKYNNIDEGVFILGTEMKDLINNFNKDKLLIMKSLMISGAYPWGFLVNEIKVGKNKDVISNEEKKFEIENDISLIIGSTSYYKYITKNFFETFLKKNSCSINSWENFKYSEYSIIECDKSKFDKNNLINFPELILEVKQDDKIFTLVLDYKDLFTETKYKFFFNVIFHSYENEIWTLGKIFLKKYLVSFDLDNKIIEIYSGNSDDKPKEENSEGEGEEEPSHNRYFLYGGIIFVLILIAGVVGYFLGKYFNKLRKKKANELSDDFEYKTNDDNIINED